MPETYRAVLPSDWVFELHQDRIEILSLDAPSVPDLDWRYVDAAGHGHFYAEDGSLPTLDLRAEPRVYDDGYGGVDEWESTIWVCPECDEHVVPARMASPTPTSVPGENWGRIEGWVYRDGSRENWEAQFSEEQAVEFLAEADGKDSEWMLGVMAALAYAGQGVLVCTEYSWMYR